ncbi:hypothetical protein [Janibacter sp. G1551]|uniref:hypothetical protein n=1 Tax=Janibacter sp. G1551 TaxID=3420440 RepID=UPI003D05263D
MTDTETVRHKFGCRSKTVRDFTGREGDLLRGCEECRAFFVVTTIEELEVAQQRPSSYACRPHHEPVTWRGRGCDECAAVIARGKASRAKRRAAARAAIEEAEA